MHCVVYLAFKVHARALGTIGDNVEPLVKEIRDYAGYYCAMALGAEKDGDLAQAFHYLWELKVEVAYPFLTGLYHGYSIGLLVKDDFPRPSNWSRPTFSAGRSARRRPTL